MLYFKHYNYLFTSFILVYTTARSILQTVFLYYFNVTTLRSPYLFIFMALFLASIKLLLLLRREALVVPGGCCCCCWCCCCSCCCYCCCCYSLSLVAAAALRGDGGLSFTDHTSTTLHPNTPLGANQSYLLSLTKA